MTAHRSTLRAVAWVLVVLAALMIATMWVAIMWWARFVSVRFDATLVGFTLASVNAVGAAVEWGVARRPRHVARWAIGAALAGAAAAAALPFLASLWVATAGFAVVNSALGHAASRLQSMRVGACPAEDASMLRGAQISLVNVGAAGVGVAATTLGALDARAPWALVGGGALLVAAGLATLVACRRAYVPATTDALVQRALLVEWLQTPKRGFDTCVMAAFHGLQREGEGEGGVRAADVARYMGALGVAMTATECGDLLATLDDDGDGVVSMAEFKAHMAERVRDAAFWKGGFRALDRNGDGRLDFAELSRALGPRVAVALLDALDANRDGTVDAAEFFAHMRSA